MMPPSHQLGVRSYGGVLSQMAASQQAYDIRKPQAKAMKDTVDSEK